jgi:hypothetical protein
MKHIKMTQLRTYMKKYALALLLLTAISACDDENGSEKKAQPGAGDSQVTLTGGPYTSPLTAKSVEAGTAVYNANEDVTGLSFIGVVNGEDVSVVLAFPGKEIGQRSWNVNENCYVTASHALKGTTDYISASYFDVSTGSFVHHEGHITIDKYEGVGGMISGSFEGKCTFMESKDERITYGTMKGSFKVIRMQ